jgi:hypothetical protein
MKKLNKKEEEKISRGKAIKKIGNYGKYAALTAVGTYLILKPQKAVASSPEPPGTGF